MSSPPTNLQTIDPIIDKWEPGESTRRTLSGQDGKSSPTSSAELQE